MKVVGLCLGSRGTGPHARSGLTKGGALSSLPWASCPHASWGRAWLPRAPWVRVGSGRRRPASFFIFLSSLTMRQMFGWGFSAGSPQEAPNEEAVGFSRLPGPGHSLNTPVNWGPGDRLSPLEKLSCAGTSRASNAESSFQEFLTVSLPPWTPKRLAATLPACFTGSLCLQLSG